MKKLFLLVALLSIGVAFAQNSKPPKAQVKGPDAELNKLMLEFGQAQDKYYEPYQQKGLTDEDRAKIRLDPNKDPRKTYLPKFKTFALHNGKSNASMRAWMQVFRLGLDVATRDQALNALVKGWPNSDDLTQVIMPLTYSYYELGNKRQAKILASLDKIDKGTTSKSVKAAVLYSRAIVIGADGSGDMVAARTLLDKLIARYPSSEFSVKAKSDIFEIENLSVGKVAPDFTAEDQDGVKFKLSDYRGQVIVLDFWGFW